MANSSGDGFGVNPSPEVARMAKWPLFVVILALVVMLGVWMYSTYVTKEQDNKDKPGETVVDIKAVEQEALSAKKGALLPSGQQAGLLREKEVPKTGGVVTPRNVQPQPTIVMHQPDKETQALQQEAEQIRQARNQRYMQALTGPIGVRKFASQAKPQEQAKQTSNVSNNDENFEANFWKTTNKDHGWLLPQERTMGMEYQLVTGTVIPGAMISGVNSDLPGVITAQVTQDVYDSTYGTHLLIPQGSKLLGMYDSSVAYGQSRCLINWNRILFPDGTSMNLGKQPGADSMGFSGVEDLVDNHYARIFGSAVLMSLVVGGTAYATNKASENQQRARNNEDDYGDINSEMSRALANQLGSIVTGMLQKNLNIAPTLEIRPGYQFNVVLVKDLAFKEPYRPWR